MHARRYLAGWAAAAVLGLAVHAHAAPITWTFTGVVRVIQLVSGGDAPPPDVLAALGVGIGAEIHGSLTWESTTPDTNPDPAFGSYDFTVTAADFTIGGWSVAPLANANNLWTVNDHQSGLPTQAILAVARLSDPSGYSQFETLALEVSGQNVTPGDAQPVHAPSLDAIDPFGYDPTSPYGYGSDLVVFGSRCTPSCYLLRAQITSLVPEAGSLAFCALAALALAVRRLA